MIVCIDAFFYKFQTEIIGEDYQRRQIPKKFISVLGLIECH